MRAFALFPFCSIVHARESIVDHAARIAYLKSLPREEAERILHTEGVTLQMKQYQKTGIIDLLALLTYGSTTLFNSSTQSLAGIYLHSYMVQPKESRNATDALAQIRSVNHSDAQTAAILMTGLEATRVAATAAQLNMSTDQVETAFIVGIAALLGTGQLINLSIMSLAITFGVIAGSLPYGKQY